MAASIDLSDLDVAREQYPLVCEVARHGGGTLDFDIILDLRRVTGIPDLNYEMYAYIDGKFDDDLLQICEDILDGTDTESLSRIQSYIQAAQPSASKELLMGLNLTLNDGQVKYTARQTASTYNEEGLVTRDGSYLDDFYQRFWADYLDDRLADMDTYNFFLRHEDDFVTDYASSSPS